MTEHRRLTRPEISILKSLATRGASSRAISLPHRHRCHAVPLWRRGIVEVWYRQAPDGQPSLQGPYYSLTISGAMLASQFLPAPRGLSGAEDDA